MDIVRFQTELDAYRLRREQDAVREFTAIDRLKEEAAGLAAQHPGAPDYVRERTAEIGREIERLDAAAQTAAEDAAIVERDHCFLVTARRLADPDWMERHSHLVLAASRHGRLQHAPDED
jgi:hypothetical protein